MIRREGIYRFQAPSSQYSLRRRRDVASVALQIPHDVSRAQLGEHLRYLFDLGRINDTSSTTSTAA